MTRSPLSGDSPPSAALDGAFDVVDALLRGRHSCRAFDARPVAPEVIRKINADVVRILQQPEIRQRLAQLGAEPVGNTPEATQAFVREEKTRWADLIRESGLKLDM